jgi:hypothetical protein
MSDRKRVDDILRRLQTGDGPPVTLSGLISDWKELVSTVAAGSGWSLASYNRGLRTRNLIEEISEGLSMEGRRAIKEVLAQIDKDFISSTFDPLKKDGGSDPGQEIGWWQYRIPKSLSGEIEFGFPEPGMGIEPPSDQRGELPQ